MMKQGMTWVFAGLFAAIFSFSSSALAGEHGGKEHGGLSTPKKQEHGGTQEHGGVTVKATPPAKQDIKDAMRDYLEDNSRNGAYNIYDADTGQMRELELIRIHQRVGKTGDYYYACCDVRDRKTGQKLDIDVDVENNNGDLSVADVRIHKVEGKARYTYDSNDNRIPL